MSGIGIDTGTFHTIAVYTGDYFNVPAQSIPSIALRATTPIVGIEAIQQLDLPLELIIAPKLRLVDIKDSVDDDEMLLRIIRLLVRQALLYLGEHSKKIVLTVPPAWKLEHCQLLQSAVSFSGTRASFIHEPIALLIAALYLSPKSADVNYASKLQMHEKFMVIDWGAGTVDLAIVNVSANGSKYNLSCMAEATEFGCGGVDIARKSVTDFFATEKYNNSENLEKTAYRLQASWQGDEFPGLQSNNFDKYVAQHRLRAAVHIAGVAQSLLTTSRLTDISQLLVVLHGGPLESKELRHLLVKNLSDVLGIDSNNVIDVGNKFAKSIDTPGIQWRRDALVATGAALFASRGETLPEFEYEVKLRDSFGRTASSIILARSANLAGIQVVTPPFTGVDYHVAVQQIGTRKTAIRSELRLHVRAGGVVMYRIAAAGVGYASIEAIEAQNLPAPIPFLDSRSDKKDLPERSTRFLIDLD